MSRRAVYAALGALTIATVHAAPALACSPPFEEPTIRALGPAQVVLVGTIGERVDGGRQFHVQTMFNGGVTTSPIVIAFKEGEPIGDCSYPVHTGQALIIAPYREPNGRLNADLGTLQAEPTSYRGRRYIAEAIALFGPGVTPSVTQQMPDPPTSSDLGPVVAIAAVCLAVAVVALIARRQRAARQEA